MARAATARRRCMRLPPSALDGGSSPARRRDQPGQHAAAVLVEHPWAARLREAGGGCSGNGSCRPRLRWSSVRSFRTRVEGGPRSGGAGGARRGSRRSRETTSRPARKRRVRTRSGGAQRGGPDAVRVPSRRALVTGAPGWLRAAGESSARRSEWTICGRLFGSGTPLAFTRIRASFDDAGIKLTARRARGPKKEMGDRSSPEPRAKACKLRTSE